MRLTPKPYMDGPSVRRLQENLDLLGYDLETDGVFGPQTDKQVRAFQQSRGLKNDGVVGPITAQAVEAAVINFHHPRSRPIDMAVAATLVDLRGSHAHPRLYAGPRHWSEIDGVTLHQTGCKMGRTARSWSRLNAHIGITRRGECVLVNDPTDMIWHAQGLSPATIGIEIEGNYCGVEGNQRTLWGDDGDVDHLTDPMIDALGLCFEWLQEEFASNDQHWVHVNAHRQSKDTRRADPGSEIWQTIAMDWIHRLGATDGGQGYCVGSGQPIPREWNSDYVGRY